MKRLCVTKKSISFWVAVILSILAGVSVFMALQQLYQPLRVFVPAENIPAGKKLQQSDLSIKTMSRRDMHPDAVTSAENVVGRYAKDKLYANEPILSSKLIKDNQNLKLPAPANLAVDETYISFKSNEAKWPNGLKEGNFVTVVGAGEFGPSVLVEKVKVIEIPDNKRLAQIDTIKTAVGTNIESITLALKWQQLGPLLSGKQLSKELWIVPEHPDKERGIYIFPSIQLGADEKGVN